METARIAGPLTGDKLYQERARSALPLLVRQARSGHPIFYSELAAELDMPNARNLNYVLGSIGQALKNLSEHWHVEVPPIQCLVVNKQTGLPGEGIGWFITDKDNFRSLPRKQQRRLIETELQNIFTFRRWDDVLLAFGLAPAKQNFSDIISAASVFRAGGESECHKRLKGFVATNPAVLGLPTTASGLQEVALPSGDCLDVLYRMNEEWVAAEVKSSISPEPDVTRGIFQCVKYQAVIEAWQASLQRPQRVRVVLVLENALPPRLLPLKNMLGVEVMENVKPG